MNESADFVLYWWDRAAKNLAQKRSATEALWARDNKLHSVELSTASDGTSLESKETYKLYFRCS